jgi:hypothetical protein
MVVGLISLGRERSGRGETKEEGKRAYEVHSDALRSSKVVERAKLDPPRMEWV